MVDIERLDNFLSSDDATENCMQISDLVGFLTDNPVKPSLKQPDLNQTASAKPGAIQDAAYL
ncbi:MAG: hypothetical protein NPIRA03_37030 [Nitrospirales bacterium]|nr:MAG: hypothetical protein NPIRA03_37030 [Nitrospirales bacterium]